MKFLALASKVKSLALASRPQVLENCSVLGSRTALFLNYSNFVDRLKKNFTRRFFGEHLKKFLKTFFFGNRLKNFFEDLFFFFGEHLRWCTWSLAVASSIPVLGLERICPRKGCPWPWPWPRIFFVSLALALASSLVSSTPPLIITNRFFFCNYRVNFGIHFKFMEFGLVVNDII